MKALTPFPAVANEASYMVRIVLPDATWEQYETLHERMANIGFFKQIVADDGRVFDLPDAEYHGTTKHTYLTVRDAIQVLANRVHPGAQVFVAEAVRMAWALPLAS